jgi:hypothetical protein
MELRFPLVRLNSCFHERTNHHLERLPTGGSTKGDCEERSGGGDLRELVEDVAVARELLGDGGGGGAGGGAAAHGVVDVLQLAEQRLDLELHGLPGGAVGGGGGGARGGGGGARGEARVGGELHVEVALQLARLPPQLLPPGLLQLQRRCRVRRRRHHLRHGAARDPIRLGVWAGAACDAKEKRGEWGVLPIWIRPRAVVGRFGLARRIKRPLRRRRRAR